LTPLNLLHLPNISQFKHKCINFKVEYVKLHEKIKTQIKTIMKGYAKYANRGTKKSDI